MNTPINKPNTYFKNVIIALFIVKDKMENIAVGKINTKPKIGRPVSTEFVIIACSTYPCEFVEATFTHGINR
jgi:hypothetical protein